MTTFFQIYPIGFVRKKPAGTDIVIRDAFADALLGLASFSHIHVLYWFHHNDSVDKRNILQVHPRKDEHNPLTGVFATHSPVRPNPLALSLCRILSITGTRIRIEDIDALDGSPVIDIKSYFPSQHPPQDIRLPEWA